ncbi:MAG: Gfo/Idh/MocA family protein [Phycisphaerae bacterium]
MTLSVGIVGLGLMGRTHLSAWQQVEGARVAAVCDMDPARLPDSTRPPAHPDAQPSGWEHTASVFDDYDTMLREASLQAVDLCVPTDLHAESARRALFAGLHVFCEKPVTLRHRDAAELAALARDRGLIVMVGHCLRFWPEYRMLAEMLTSGRLGRVERISLQRLGTWPTWSAGDWLSDVSRSGLAAMDLHVHDADVVLWWLGRPRAVTSSGVSEDCGGVSYIQTRYDYGPDGPEVTAEGGWVHDADPFRMAVHIETESAVVEYHSIANPTLTIRHRDGRVERPRVPQANAYVEELRHFTRSILGEGAVEHCSIDQAVQAVRLVEGELQAIRSGRTFVLDW